jgi:hypothetical protein
MRIFSPKVGTIGLIAGIVTLVISFIIAVRVTFSSETTRSFL